ncbi:MAG: tyrosine-type recombinase/integrase [Planctomycetota bacterium]|nr:MAG: tyrosine-type recombinase/integrase [Planctomycetota bacterium]
MCFITSIDLDIGSKVWVYSSTIKRPQRIPIGPKAQRYIKPFLQREVTAFLFSPRESLHQKWDQCETHRHQPVEAPKTTRRVGTKYTLQAYGYYIRRICKKHNIPHWSPNQLRHNALTRFRQQFGLDGAQVIGGHTKSDTTEIYAELDLKKAISIMEKVG